jgi:cytochrome c2
MLFSRVVLGADIIASTLALALVGMSPTSAFAGDATADAKVFKKCAAYRSLKAGKQKFGPIRPNGG